MQFQATRRRYLLGPIHHYCTNTIHPSASKLRPYLYLGAKHELSQIRCVDVTIDSSHCKMWHSPARALLIDEQVRSLRAARNNESYRIRLEWASLGWAGWAEDVMSSVWGLYVSVLYELGYVIFVRSQFQDHELRSQSTGCIYHWKRDSFTS
jgi:hypothetical protein